MESRGGAGEAGPRGEVTTCGAGPPPHIPGCPPPPAFPSPTATKASPPHTQVSLLLNLDGEEKSDRSCTITLVFQPAKSGIYQKFDNLAKAPIQKGFVSCTFKRMCWIFWVCRVMVTCVVIHFLQIDDQLILIMTLSGCPRKRRAVVHTGLTQKLYVAEKQVGIGYKVGHRGLGNRSAGAPLVAFKLHLADSIPDACHFSPRHNFSLLKTTFIVNIATGGTSQAITPLTILASSASSHIPLTNK